MDIDPNNPEDQEKIQKLIKVLGLDESKQQELKNLK